MAKLIIDTRETLRTRGIVRLALPPGQTTEQCLETGDFMLFDQDGHAAVIERKTVGDLLTSFGSGRLHKQMQRLATLCSHPILLIEGHMRMTPDGKIKLPNRTTKWSHAAVQMMLLGLQRRQGIDMFWTYDTSGTADILRVLHQRSLIGCFDKETGARGKERVLVAV